MSGNGSSSNGSSSGNGTAQPASTKTNGSKPLLKRPSSGIVVSKVVKKSVAQPVRPAHLSNGSSAGNGHASLQKRNALPEETRRRIEELRREKERKAREEEDRIRAQKVASRKPPRDEYASKKKRAKRYASDDDDDDDDESLFSGGDSTPKKNKESSSRAQSVSDSSCYQKLGRADVTSHYLVPRNLLNPASFDNEPSQDEERAIQGADLLTGKVYGPFFHGLDGEVRVQLEYPADGCLEEFTLLSPKDSDEYDPISDLLRSVRCIVEFYLTEEQQALFGSLDSLETSTTAGNLLVNGRGSATPADVKLVLSPLGTADHSRESTPIGNDAATSQPVHSVPHSPARSAIFANATAVSTPTGVTDVDRDPILRSFTKARNRRDGPLFVRTVERFNTTLRSLKETGKIRENVELMSKKGVSEGIWRCVQEQCYARTVAPRVEELSKYEAFSDNVYGELLPRFMSEIAQLTGLGPNSVFVDLGSGVGNLLIQVALQTGSESFGCEQMAAPSELASLQVAEAKRRWRMWGLHGAKTEAWRGDFGEDENVRDVLRRADVVLVNNYAFTAKTNDNLSLLFLDLKDGAQVVSLKPFVPSDFRLTERTLSSPLAILRVAQRQYTSGCVSWADGGGRYYIHTVDRSLVARFYTEHVEFATTENTTTTKDVRKRQWKAVQEESSGEED